MGDVDGERKLRKKESAQAVEPMTRHQAATDLLNILDDVLGIKGELVFACRLVI